MPARRVKLVLITPVSRVCWVSVASITVSCIGYIRYKVISRKDAGAEIWVVACADKSAVYDGDLAKGFYVAPTVVTGLPATHRLFKDELFVPFVVVAKISSFEEGITLANESDYALTAGCFTEDEKEIRTFLDTIHGGVIYVNRRAGSTTGAWPMVQPFGGWKKSGTTGKSGGGLYYVQQYLREQSQTVVR